jgi:hypothetical protein
VAFPLAGDPRLYGTRRLAATDWLVVTNSDVAWSATTAATYMAARGIPSGNVVAVPLGTDAVAYDPGSNAAILTAIADPIRTKADAVGALGVLLAPGTPNNVVVRGRRRLGIWEPASTGNAPLSVLAAGCRSYADRLAARGGTLLVTTEGTGTNVQWAGSANPTVSAASLWQGFVSDFLGLGVTTAAIYGAAPQTQLSATFGPSTTVGLLATPAATQSLAVTSPVMPVGRIGYSAWRAVSVPESSSNALGSLTAATAGLALTSQPAPILLGIRDLAGFRDVAAAMYERATDWGYAAKYYWRETPTGTAATVCPAGGADEAFTNAQLVGGSVVDYSHYLHYGVAENTDDPETLPPFDDAFLPATGGGSYLPGFSDGFDYALRGLARGAAWGITDVTHRTAFGASVSWVSVYLMLAGMTPAEAMYWGGAPTVAAAIGDPLYPPWHFDAATNLPPAGGGGVSSGQRSPRRWAARRLRATA